MSQSPFEELPVLSDYDVQILYEVVSIAETSDSPLFRALFAAYDEVLEQHDIRPEHDRVYFRFLLRMGGNGDATQSLFERFRLLLHRLGIHIHFGPKDTDSTEADVPTVEPVFRPEEDHTTASGWPAISRRASFDSALEATPRKTRARFLLQVDSPSRSRSHDTMHRRPQQGRTSNGILNKDTKHEQGRPMRRPRQTRSPGKHKVSLHRPGQVMRNHPTYLDRREPLLTESDEDGSVANGSDHGFTQPNGISTTDLRVRQRSAQEIFDMKAYAEAFRVRGVIAIARVFLHKINRKAVVLQSMSRLGKQHDAITLRRQAFEQWRIQFLNKKGLAEMEQFFAELDSRAQRARDMFLLTKAFTHWAQITSEEILRKRAARAKILQTRCLNAWRDITVVNEHKVRRQRLGKVFRVWKRRLVWILEQRRRASQTLAANLVSRLYRHWFWHFCERRAPRWHDSKLMDKMFMHWLTRSHGQMRDFLRARCVHDVRLARAALSSWTAATKSTAAAADRAMAFRARHLAAPVLQLFGRNGVMLPRLRQLQQIVTTRIVREALQCWILRARAVFQARSICSSRVTRNAWTSWNDRLRHQTLAHTIDDRVALQALYRWVIMERLKLCERRRGERFRHNIFDTWRRKTDDLCFNLGRAKFLADQSLATRKISATFACWKSRSQKEARRLRIAGGSRSNHLSTPTLETWIVKYQTVQRLQSFSSDARYFALATKTFRAWREALTARRRTKRRDAYTIMRRRTKMALAQRVLRDWHGASTHLLELRAEAADMAVQRGLHLQTKVLAIWSDRYSRLRAEEDRAEAIDSARLIRDASVFVQLRLERLANFDKQARGLLAQAVETRANGVLRRLNWRLFQIKRQQETAESLCGRTRRKHYRNMLKYWAERAAQKRNPPSTFLSSTTGVVIAQANDDSVMQVQDILAGSAVRNESGAVFVAAAEHEHRSVMLQTPGYLRTPSRRTSKARGARIAGFAGFAVAAAGPPVTPAARTTQVTRFMDRLLEVQTPDMRARSARADIVRDWSGRGMAVEGTRAASPSRDGFNLD